MRLTRLQRISELLSQYQRKTKGKESLHTLLNAARRQTIPAFREKGVWKIGKV